MRAGPAKEPGSEPLAVGRRRADAARSAQPADGANGAACQNRRVSCGVQAEARAEAGGGRQRLVAWRLAWRMAGGRVGGPERGGHAQREVRWVSLPDFML